MVGVWPLLQVHFNYNSPHVAAAQTFATALIHLCQLIFLVPHRNESLIPYKYYSFVARTGTLYCYQPV